MDGDEWRTDIFSDLDHAPVPSAWLPDLSDTLLGLVAALHPINRSMLAPLLSRVTRHTLQLKEHAAKAARVEPPKEIHDSHPASATLFKFRHGRSRGLELLTGIGLSALLEASEVGRRPPKRLLSMLRGALEDRHSPISGALGAIVSIPELVRVVDTDESTRQSLPGGFVQLWDGWLRDTLVRWMLAEPDRLRQALEPQALSSRPEDPQIRVSLVPHEPERGVELSCVYVAPFEDDPTRTGSSRLARAAADQLDRASIGDLLLPAEHFLPGPIDQRLCQSAVHEARRQLSEDAVAGERFVALALLLAGGVREIDLRDVVWGGEADAKPQSIDPVAPILYRRIKRPPNAVKPSKELSGLLEPVADVIAWPLPDSVHALLLQLAGGAHAGQPVLPELGTALAAPYRMVDAVAHLVPEAQVGALAPRLALASELAGTLGVEMAQMAMADTFGMPSIPTYYSALPEAYVAQHVAKVQSRRFGEVVVVPSGRTGYVGSRLVLSEAAAKHWPKRLRDAVKFASRHPDNLVEEWRACRDHLVGALCSATGHRPEDALGKIFLGDVIPEYGLIILQDKQVDALRAARIAATGKLWLSDLRRYLDRLTEIASQRMGMPEGALATAILCGEGPLFSLPSRDGTVTHMSAAALRQGMPPELQSVDNFYRHRLNQVLQEQEVDPELRHAQLGWVVSPAHFHSDLSPSSPIALGEQLGPVIDAMLVADGWYLPSARKTRWTWDGVPLPSPIDWVSIFASHKRQHEEGLKQIRMRLQARGKDLEGPLLSRLGDAFQEICPLLKVDCERKVLIPIVPGGSVELTADHYAFLCDRVRQGDLDPSSGLESVMTRILLYRLVRRARQKGVVRGPIPGRPFLAITAEPSPFVPGLGAAIRQVHLVRGALRAVARRRRRRDLAPLTAWTILAFSMYRRLHWAQATTGAAAQALRSKSRAHLLRIAVPTKDGAMHMVLGGAPAALLARLKRMPNSPRAPSLPTLENWATKHLSLGVDWGGSGVAAARLEGVLGAAASIELSGMERALLTAGAQSAAEMPSRCIAKEDGWPVRTAEVARGEKTAASAQASAEDNMPAVSPRPRRNDYSRFAALLNRRSFARTRVKQTVGGSDGNRGWRRALEAELLRLRDQVGPDSNLAVLIGYTLDHLRHGSEEGNRLSHSSLRREVTQIGWPLLLLAGERSLLGLSGDELRRLYREVVLSKSSQGRPYAAEELQRFHRYMFRVHALPGVDMGELAAIAGARSVAVEPGLLTDAECRIVWEQLRDETEYESRRADTNPDLLRLTKLRQIFYLILEAAGIRPGSAYGLTLRDILFLDGSADFVHVRRGTYGEAKTAASLGFVRLEGELWQESRDWVRGWIDDQRAIHPEEWEELPLFGSRPSSRTRVHEHHLTGRISLLLKWSTGNSSAHGYWLRKSRISERFRQVSRSVNPRARQVHGLLAASGHAWIQVTLERYINDPVTVMVAEQLRFEETSRSLMLDMAGLPPGAMDAAWNRASGGQRKRMAVVIDRLGVDCVDAPLEHRTPAPDLTRAKVLLPEHVDVYARALHRGRGQAEAALEAGLTLQQVKQLDAAAVELLTRRGFTPLKVSTELGRSVIPPPRKLAGTEKWFDILREVPSHAMTALADSWITRPFSDLAHGSECIMSLEPHLAAATHEVLHETGLQLEVVPSGEHYLIREAPRRDRGTGHGAAFRWVIALIWVYQQARTCPD